MRRIIVSLLLAIMAITCTSAPALAYLPVPSGITIESAKVFRNLTESGDMLVVFHCDIDTGSSANSTPASQAIMYKLVSVNGTLQKTSTPYVYSLFETNGFGNGASSFYFAPEDAPNWGEAYQIQVTGLPLHYADPVPTQTYALQSSDYDTSSDQATNQSDLYTYVIGLADLFHIIYPDVSLKSTTDVGTVLSSYGEAYFKATIPGLLYLCPDLFYIQTLTPETMTTTAYNMSQKTVAEGRLAGSDLERGANRAGAMIGVSGAFFWGILYFILLVIICAKCQQKGWGIYPGLAVGFLVLCGCAVLIGNLFFTLMMILALLAVIGIFYIWVLRRA